MRSRARLTYAEVADAVSTGTAGEPLTLLREIGELRLAAQAARGGVRPTRRTFELRGNLLAMP